MDIHNLLKSLDLSLLNLEDCKAENWNFEKVTSPFTRLYLVKDGEGMITHNNKVIKLKPGWLYLIPSYTQCNLSSNTFLDHIYIHFIPSILGGANIYSLFEFSYEVEIREIDCLLIKRLLELNKGKRLLNYDPKKYCKENLTPQLPNEYSVRQISNCMETQSILLLLFSRFLKTYCESANNKNKQLNSQIRLAVDYIHNNISNSFKLSELADACCLSKDYFSRLFLKTMGIRPIDYINQKRIEQAQLCLITTNDTIENIALDVGIYNYSYFNRLFKKYSSKTPNEYRRLHKLV
jgi:AraC-like DNA-binding protein